jgi:hypothetical protein
MCWDRSPVYQASRFWQANLNVKRGNVWSVGGKISLGQGLVGQQCLFTSGDNLSRATASAWIGKAKFLGEVQSAMYDKLPHYTG